MEALTEQLQLWKSLRHDLERARMLVELVRKREKLKREQVTSLISACTGKCLWNNKLMSSCFMQLRMAEEISRLRLIPSSVVMKRILAKLAAKDPADIFAEPVSPEEVSAQVSLVSFTIGLPPRFLIIPTSSSTPWTSRP